LLKRLIPYAAAQNLRMLKEFDDLHATTQFVESWRNLSLHRKPGSSDLLKDTTRKAELERLRSFFCYCKDRGWLKENRAKNLKFKTVVAKKFGLEPDEEKRVFAALAASGDVETELFCRIMRETGLRISDVTALCDSQIVRRQSGAGWAIQLLQEKTDDLVYVPILDSLEVAFQAPPEFR
jgi:integrase